MLFNFDGKTRRSGDASAISTWRGSTASNAGAISNLKSGCLTRFSFMAASACLRIQMENREGNVKDAQ